MKEHDPNKSDNDGLEQAIPGKFFSSIFVKEPDLL